MNFIAKRLITQTPAEQVAEILHLLRPLLRQSEGLINGATVDGVTPADDVTPAMSRLLGCLQAEGAQTVPALARSLGTGRQFIQRMANDLLSCGLIERGMNPAHQKSWIISLTEKGHAHVEHITRHEHDAMKELANGVTGDELQICLSVLEQFMHELSGRERSQPVSRVTHKPVHQQITRVAVYPEEFPEETPHEQGTDSESSDRESFVPEHTEPADTEPAHTKPAHTGPAAALNWNGGGGLQIG